MNKIRILFLGLAVLAISGCSLLPGEEGYMAPPLITPNPPAISAKAVTLGDIVVEFSVQATCTSTEVSYITMPIDGVLSDFPRIQGDFTRRGQKLGTIDTTHYEVVLMQAQLAVAQATRDLQSARQSGQEVLTKAAEIVLREAEIHLDDVQATFDACGLESPINGTVNYQNRDIGKGDYVKEGTLLYRILDITQLRLEFLDPDPEGALAKNFIAGERVTISTSVKGEERLIAGEVLQAPDLYTDVTDNDTQTQRLRRTVVFTFDEDDSTLFFFNQSYSVSKIVKERRNTLLVPRMAINTHQDRTFVYVLEENGLYVERDVLTGETDGRNVEILSGLIQDEMVVVSK